MITAVKAACDNCGASGLVNINQDEKTAEVCNTCNGKGCVGISYTVFTQRREVDGVSIVKLSEPGETMSYEDFAATLGREPEPFADFS